VFPSNSLLRILTDDVHHSADRNAKVRGVRTGEQRFALHALNACQMRIVNKEDQQTAQDLIKAASISKAASSSDD